MAVNGTFGEQDLHLWNEGNHYGAYRKLGAHLPAQFQSNWHRTMASAAWASGSCGSSSRARCASASASARASRAVRASALVARRA